MEALIAKIQQEVDESNRKEEQEIALKKKEEKPLFDKNNLVTFNLSGIENAVKFLLENFEKLGKEVEKAQKEIKSRSYIVDKVHKEGNERDEKVKEMEK